MSDPQPSSSNSIWAGLFVLLLPVLGAAMVFGWQQYDHARSLEARVAELDQEVQRSREVAEWHRQRSDELEIQHEELMSSFRDVLEKMERQTRAHELPDVDEHVRMTYFDHCR